MGFKLGSEKRRMVPTFDKKSKGKRVGDYKGSPILSQNMEEGTLAEANMDGTISVDPSINLNSKKGKRLLKHEKQHIDDIDSGRAAYNDNVVMWEGKMYLRRDIGGEKVIDGPNGRWPEGHPKHPWEQSAIQAEKRR